MKKIIYSLAAMLALSFSFVSCGDDDDTISFPTTPEKAAAGTYTGLLPAHIQAHGLYLPIQNHLKVPELSF